MNKALHSRDNIDYMCQEKKEKEDTPALKIASMHRLDDSKKNVKKNNCTDIWSDKQAKSQMRRLGHC